MMCPGIKQEQLFLDALGRTDHYKIKSMVLILYDSENKELLNSLVDQSYTWYDYGIFILLALIAYAAIDWVFDRRLTNMLGIK